MLTLGALFHSHLGPTNIPQTASDIPSSLADKPITKPQSEKPAVSLASGPGITEPAVPTEKPVSETAASEKPISSVPVSEKPLPSEAPVSEKPIPSEPPLPVSEASEEPSKCNSTLKAEYF